jgi:hypothetical protein
MRRIVWIAVFTSLVVALIVAPAGAAAKAKKLSVTMFTGPFPECSVAPDKVRMAIAFQAKVKAKNVKLPSRITVAYKISNPQTGEIKVAENVTLKPKDYFDLGAFLGYTVGSQWQLDASFTFKNTATGKSVTSKNSMSLTVPTNDELTAGGITSCV